MLDYRQLEPAEVIPEEQVTVTVNKHRLETFIFCELVEGCDGCPTEKVRKCCQKIGALAKEFKDGLRVKTGHDSPAKDEEEQK